ncbi:MAG: glycerophosphodiester phosphodiesterase [Clostridia bacterium]|nr:glycerophosphodiester phosphodiesterase [Clostridia bacterium]
MFNCKLEVYKNSPVKINDAFTYTAHTGCLDTKDNSLESIDVGVCNGAQIVEFDVNYYDGIPVLSHDEPKGGEISLEQAFLKVKEYDNLRVNVDIKNTEYLEKVQIIAEETGVLDRIFFTGINLSDVEAVKKACPDVEYYLNVDVSSPKAQDEEYLMSLVAQVKECGAVGINFNKANATQELVDIFHENGLLVSIWTVNNKIDIYKILSYGPDNITTRRPDKLKAAIKEIKDNA